MWGGSGHPLTSAGKLLIPLGSGPCGHRAAMAAAVWDFLFLPGSAFPASREPRRKGHELPPLYQLPSLWQSQRPHHAAVTPDPFMPRPRDHHRPG